MTAVDAEPLLYTAEEASRRLGGIKSANWLKVHARNGSIPFTPLGKTLAWSEQNLRDLIERESRSPADYGRRRKSA